MAAFLDTGDRSSHLTVSTTASHTSDYFSSRPASTALTTPTLGSPPPLHSPKHSFHSLENIEEDPSLGMHSPPAEAYDDDPMDPMYADEVEVSPERQDAQSVRSRRSHYDDSLSAHSDSNTSHLKMRMDDRARSKSPMQLPAPYEDRPRSTSPMRLPPIEHLQSPLASPLRSPQHSGRHVRSPSPLAHHRHARSPSPLGLPPHSPSAHSYHARTPSPRHRDRLQVPVTEPPPRQRSRDPPSTSNMIAQWESAAPPATEPRGRPPPENFNPSLFPLDVPMDDGSSSPSPRRYKQQYLDKKPLPLPCATAIPASANMPWPPPGGPSPVRSLNTPNSRHSPNISPSSWSPTAKRKRKDVSPGKSGKSPMKRSPFKEIVNVFSGLRNAKTKDKHTGWGTAGVGVHGDQPRQFLSLDDDTDWFAKPRPMGSGLPGGIVFSDRMGDAEMNASTDAHQESDGSVMSTAVLFLASTPCSSVPPLGTWTTAWGKLSPRSLDISSCSLPYAGEGCVGTGLPVPYSVIPRPPPGTVPDIELLMADCTEVMVLRREEVRMRGVPLAPEGVDTEVLELSFADGSKRYMGVEGKSRLGWCSAIWDMLHASKPSGSMPSSKLEVSNQPHPMNLPMGLQNPPVQMVGDTWVAAGELEGGQSTLRGSERPGSDRLPPFGRSLPPTPDLGLAREQPMVDNIDTVDDYAPGSLPYDEPMPAAKAPSRPQLQSPAPTLEHVSKQHVMPSTPPVAPTPKRARSTAMEERLRAWGKEEDSTPLGPRRLPVMPATEPLKLRERPKNDLREAVVNMFNGAPDKHHALGQLAPTRSTLMEQRIRAWQPKPEQTPPPLERNPSDGREYKCSDSALSFDPSDLNPSRSASQVRRPTAPSSVVGKSAEAVVLSSGAPSARVPARERELPALPEVLAEKEAGFSSGGPRAPRNLAGPRPPLSLKKTLRAEPEHVAIASMPKEVCSPAASRIGSKLMATAAMFEPAIAQSTSTPNSERRAKRKPVPIIPGPASTIVGQKPEELEQPVLPVAVAVADTPSPPREPVRRLFIANASPTLASTPLLPSAEPPTPPQKPRVLASVSAPAKAEGSLVEAEASRPAAVKVAAAAVTAASVSSAKTDVSKAPSVASRLALAAGAPKTVSVSSTTPKPRAALTPTKLDLKPPSTTTPLRLSTPARDLALASPRSTRNPSSLVAQRLAMFENGSSDTGSPAPVPGSPSVSMRRAMFEPTASPSVHSHGGTDKDSIISYYRKSSIVGSSVDESHKRAPVPVVSRALSVEVAPEPVPLGLGITVPNTPSTDKESGSKFSDRAVVGTPLAVDHATRDISPAGDQPLEAPVLAEHETAGEQASRELDLQDTSRALNGMPGALPEALTGPVLARLNQHTDEHDTLSRQVFDVHEDLAKVVSNLGELSMLVQQRSDDLGPALPAELAQRLDAIGTDVRGMHLAVQSSSAATAEKLDTLVARATAESEEKTLPPPPATELVEPLLPEVHAKLDAIAHLIQEVLSRQAEIAAVPPAPPVVAAAVVPSTSAPNERELPKTDEAPASPTEAAPPISEKLGEVHGLVKDLQGERQLQTQQTADIARYLAELNTWLEKFVQNSGTELESMSKRINSLVGEAPPEGGPASGLVADIHNMLAAQNQRLATADAQAQRLDSLLGLMGQDRERHAADAGVVQNIMSIVDKQRADNENLLRAVATDLTSEIRGERVRFIEAMQQATTMNIQVQVDEFKKVLSTEVSKSMRELGQMREQKKTLEHQISDLFALKAKHFDDSPASPAVGYPAPAAPPSPGGPRTLPMPPH